MLAEQFDDLLIKIGNQAPEHPVFYKSPVAIRFEIGCGTPYSNAPGADGTAVNPEYVGAALRRAKAIYEALPQTPDLLRIDTYPNENASECGNESDLNAFLSAGPFPFEQRSILISDGGEQYEVLQLYWNLYGADYSPDPLLGEIIKADLGGISALASSVYFANTKETYLYHVYDDRGADLAAQRRETLRSIYENFNQWILEYDREKIDKLFAE
jgi:hypothetical protein